jgi:hypothetical protein
MMMIIIIIPDLSGFFRKKYSHFILIFLLQPNKFFQLYLYYYQIMVISSQVLKILLFIREFTLFLLIYFILLDLKFHHNDTLII